MDFGTQIPLFIAFSPCSHPSFAIILGNFPVLISIFSPNTLSAYFPLSADFYRLLSKGTWVRLACRKRWPSPGRFVVTSLFPASYSVTSKNFALPSACLSSMLPLREERMDIPQGTSGPGRLSSFPWCGATTLFLLFLILIFSVLTWVVLFWNVS